LSLVCRCGVCVGAEDDAVVCGVALCVVGGGR